MKKFLFIFLVTEILILTSCQQPDTTATQIHNLNTSDTFRFEFPKRNGAIDSFLIKSNFFYEKHLKLISLKKGFDSIQIRIWYGGALAGQRMISLTNKNGEWVAEISTLNSYDNPDYKRGVSSYDEMYLPSRTIEYKTPKSGWKKFVNELFKLNILTLPNEEDIEGLKRTADYADGCGAFFEIATKNVYRVFTYGEMDPDLEKYEQLQNVSQILNIVDEEFGLEKLWDYKNQIKPTFDTSTNKIKIDEITLQEVSEKPKKKKRN
jgi:hypothetical protein